MSRETDIFQKAKGDALQIPKSFRGKLCLYILLQFLKRGLLLVPPYCYLLFLEEVITQGRLELLLPVFALYIGVFLGKTLTSVLVQAVYNRIFPVLTAQWKDRVLRRYGALDIPALQGYTPGELKERLHRDTENMVMLWEKKLEFGISLIHILITACILLYLNWILFLASCLLLPLSFFVTRRIKGRSNAEYGKIRSIQTEYNDFCIHNLYFWKEVKTGAAGREQEKEFERLWDAMGKAFLKTHMFWFMNRTFLAFKDVFLTKMGLYLLGGILVIRQLATVPVLLAFMEYYGDFVNSLLALSDNVMLWGGQEESAKRVRALMELPMPERPLRLDAFEKLELRQIGFSYENNRETILRDFSMELCRGEKLALVGESGCGKSTLIRLMAGCLEQDRGEIFWNGQPFRLIQRTSLYEKASFLMQETSLFNLTIRENLLFGRDVASEEEMTDACTRANIMDFIRELPLGFETVIGENGIRLSGGQRQRLLIARLLLKNPQLIVFDEATSALDYQNENEILDLLLSNARDKTVIMVTHRSTSAAKCSRSVCLERKAMGI